LRNKLNYLDNIVVLYTVLCDFGRSDVGSG